MSYFDDASLVMIPSGTKTSKVYSVKPIDGTGDLTFTRSNDTATRVNSAGLIESVLANVPRLDYLNSTCPRLILEPSRSNLVLRSQEFDNAAWVKTNVSVTANSIISPDGSMNADTLAGNGSAGIHIIQQIILAYGANDTISIFAKKGTNNFIQIYTDFVNTDYANFNLNTGVVGDKGATTGAATITDYGNGWYRCTMVTGSALSGNVNIALISSATSARAETNSLSTNLYIYGAQLESGDYATSYIPTTTALVTRGVDLAVDTAASSLIGQTEGTIYAEVNFDSNVNTEGYIVRLDDTSFNDTIIISRGNDKRLNAILRAGGSTIVNIQQDNFNGLKRVAFAYKSGSFAVYVDGVQVGTSAATYTNGITYGEVRIGGFDASTANMSGGISKVLLFKTRLTNAQLAELTTL